ncbi:unnamed protein product [Cylicostephanus goldi]|uniref:Heterogeneous nuclear ribonucleoprotein L RRM domain-containing protein n=1 Tax=Cylicostephanus goldi TaxID=71465 RepID=A0A3P6T196_CYLGO|nr:unnamed protein product [Cylicostephanus goldi]
MVYGIELQSGIFSCDRLFNLMCMYGHVVAIKLVTRIKDAAIVEFAHSSSVNIAMNMLQNVVLFGCTLSFDYGRNDAIRMTTDRFPNGMPMCELYTNCPLQRFSRYQAAESSAKIRIAPPSSMLYWWDAPTYTTREMIYMMFVSVGAAYPCNIYPFKPGPSSSVGIVEFPTSRQAAEALMLVNHFPILLPGFRVSGDSFFIFM